MKPAEKDVHRHGNSYKGATAIWLRITPEMAQGFLHDAPPNFRNLNNKRVSKYETDMQDDEWGANGKTILLDKNWKCIDGRTRLMACIRTGNPFITLVVYGVTDLRGIDKGQPRTYAQELRNRGELYSSVLASAVRLHHIINYGAGVLSMSSEVPSESQLDSTLSKDPGLRQSVKFMNTIRFGGVTGLWSSLHHDFRFDGDQLRCQFFSGVKKWESQARDDPRYKLGNFAASARKGKRPDYSLYYALTVKAWNSFRVGRPMKSLRWVQFGKTVERVPEIDRPKGWESDPDPLNH